MVLSASRFAYHMLTDILPLVDYAVDFHAGGANLMPLKLDSHQTIQN
jgi:predicted deacylase